MIVQYPHIASVIVTSDGGTDNKGYPLPPYETAINIICRAEPNSSSAIINTPDGTAYNFKYVVYIKKEQSDVPVGSRIIQISDPSNGQVLFTDDGQALSADNSSSFVTNNSVLSSSGSVKMYSKGQLNARLWL